ncbi:efflux RND transporter periplasmic adaptor subunit [Rhizobium sp. 2YAF20]|uniref:efflux RND transporter periplasmic adaptor subunit n=1 Tax=Rhizobium sp. 2YAF20 TaxID=3233027 RepID=UPI003F965B4A
MKKFWLALSLLAVAVLAVWSYRDRIPYVAALIDQASAATKSASSTQKPKREAPPTVVKTVAAVRRTLPTDITATGSAVAQDTTTIAAQEAGIITSVQAQDGAMVKTGDLIATLDARTAQAAVDKDKAQQSKDEAALAQTESALTRAQSLLNSAGTQQTVDLARVARDTASADVNSDKAQLAADQVLLEHTQIRAPFDGRLGAVALSLGAYVSPGTAIVSIAQYDPVYVNFHLQESHLRELKDALAGGPVAVSTIPRSDKGKSRQGQVSFYDNNVDAASGTILVKAKFENSNGAIWPGQSINLVMHFNNTDQSIVVPTVAVNPGADGFFAYVIKDSKVKLTPVTVERANGGFTAIATGISEGDHLVVEGQVQLSDGQKVTEQFNDGATQNLASAATKANQQNETIAVGAGQ